MDTENNLLQEEPFYNRLIEEKTQLDERIAKLKTFLYPVITKSIQPMQVTLLMIQLKAMQTYSLCLQDRLDLLNQGEPEILITKIGDKLTTLSKEELTRKNKTIK